MSTGQQFGRKVSLIVANQVNALDLSNLRITFRVAGADTQSPNTAYIKVYNLSDKTVNQVLKEFDNVILQAGYEDGNFGVIFKGTIKQVKKGKETNVNSYVEIRAADNDIGYNNGFLNQTLNPGVTPQQQLEVHAQAIGVPVDPNAPQTLTGGILPRGKVLFGLARDPLRELAMTNGARWGIQNGVLTLIPLTGYLPGVPIQINSATGMIGVPESTENGITVRILLNPLVQIGQRVEINNKDVTQTIIKEQFFPNYKSDPAMFADVTNDGIYRVIVVEHSGDTRGQDWYSDLVCLALDPSAKNPSKSVLPFG